MWQAHCPENVSEMLIPNLTDEAATRGSKSDLSLVFWDNKGDLNSKLFLGYDILPHLPRMG